MNIGVIVPHLGSSQLAYLTITYCNIGSAVTQDQFYVFTKNPSEPCVRPAFSCLNISELAGFNGMLIATDLDSADILTKIPTSGEKIFYVWDLEFMRKRLDYRRAVKLYRNANFKLFVRSHEHARIVDNYANREVYVVPQFNILHMREIITGEKYEFHR